MLFETVGQWEVFLWMACFGAFGGCAYTLSCGLRKLLCAGRWLSLTVDLAFSVVLDALFLAGLITSVRGSFRLYCLIGFVCGFAVFMLSAARILSGVAGRIMVKMRRFFCVLSKKRLCKAIFR